MNVEKVEIKEPRKIMKFGHSFGILIPKYQIKSDNIDPNLEYMVTLTPFLGQKVVPEAQKVPVEI